MRRTSPVSAKSPGREISLLLMKMLQTNARMTRKEKRRDVSGQTRAESDTVLCR